MQLSISFVQVKLKFLESLRSRRLRSVLAGMALAVAAVVTGAPAQAGNDRVVGTRYDLSIAGILLASFKFSSKFDGHGYIITGQGDSSPLVTLISEFKGITKSAGDLSGLDVRPTSYKLRFRSGGRRQTVEMHFDGGAIDKLAVDPPQSPSPARIPVKPAHQTNVLDPLSAVLLPLPQGKLDGESVCDRRLPIFDGRQRYDLVLSYKRTESAPVAGKPQARTSIFVCKIKYEPIAGHKPKHASTRYWQDSEDIELWLAPVTSAGMLVPYRALLPTPLGSAVLALSKLTISKGQQHAALSPTGE